MDALHLKYLLFQDSSVWGKSDLVISDEDEEDFCDMQRELANVAKNDTGCGVLGWHVLSSNSEQEVGNKMDFSPIQPPSQDSSKATPQTRSEPDFEKCSLKMASNKIEQKFEVTIKSSPVTLN